MVYNWVGFSVVYKYFSKNGWSLSIPKMNTGLEVGGAGAGSDKKFRRESMAKLNEFSRELRTFREVDLAGTVILHIRAVHLLLKQVSSYVAVL